MKLHEYLKSHNITQVSLANRLGIAREYLNRLINGKSLPSTYLAKKIEKETGGKVSFFDLFEEEFPKLEKKGVLNKAYEKRE